MNGAISVSELTLFGCPYCGCRSVYMAISQGGLMNMGCGECNKPFYVLADGLEVSDVEANGAYPRRVNHPRQGIPAHGRPDLRPENGGEFFRSRGIGSDWIDGCFVCGGAHKLYNNIAAFVQGKAAGERIHRMFAQGGRLDYREHSPDRVQYKLGACNQHLPKLRWLQELTREADGVITSEMVLRVLQTPVPHSYILEGA